MKVTAKSDDHLTVESKPWFVTGAMWVLGLAALMGGVFDGDMAIVERFLVLTLGAGTCGLAWWFVPFTSLDFDRPAGTLVVTYARITGAEQTAYALTDVERTLVQYGSTDGADVERLALKTSTGVTPVEFGYFSTPRKDVMTEINEWLDMEQRA